MSPFEILGWWSLRTVSQTKRSHRHLRWWHSNAALKHQPTIKRTVRSLGNDYFVRCGGRGCRCLKLTGFQRSGAGAIWRSRSLVLRHGSGIIRIRTKPHNSPQVAVNAGRAAEGSSRCRALAKATMMASEDSRGSSQGLLWDMVFDVRWWVGLIMAEI